MRIKGIEDLGLELEPIHLSDEELASFTQTFSELSDQLRALRQNETVNALLPIDPDELAQLAYAFAQAKSGEASRGLVLGANKLVAIEKYLDFLSWFIQDFHPMLQRRIELAEAGEEVTVLRDEELRAAIAARDAQACGELMTYYFAARCVFAQRHNDVDTAMLRALLMEGQMLAEDWADETWWQVTFDLLDLDISSYLPALPAQAD